MRHAATQGLYCQDAIVEDNAITAKGYGVAPHLKVTM